MMAEAAPPPEQRRPSNGGGGRRRSSVKYKIVGAIDPNLLQGYTTLGDPRRTPSSEPRRRRAGALSSEFSPGRMQREELERQALIASMAEARTARRRLMDSHGGFENHMRHHHRRLRECKSPQQARAQVRRGDQNGPAAWRFSPAILIRRRGSALDWSGGGVAGGGAGGGGAGPAASPRYAAAAESPDHRTMMPPPDAAAAYHPAPAAPSPPAAGGGRPRPVSARGWQAGSGGGGGTQGGPAVGAACGAQQQRQVPRRPQSAPRRTSQTPRGPPRTAEQAAAAQDGQQPQQQHPWPPRAKPPGGGGQVEERTSRWVPEPTPAEELVNRSGEAVKPGKPPAYITNDYEELRWQLVRRIVEGELYTEEEMLQMLLLVRDQIASQTLAGELPVGRDGAVLDPLKCTKVISELATNLELPMKEDIIRGVREMMEAAKLPVPGGF